MPPTPRAPRPRSASTPRRSTRRSTPQVMAGWISRGSSSTSAVSQGNSKEIVSEIAEDMAEETAMTTFQEARAFLLKHRTDYDVAVKRFRWPDPVPFNWALEWFDAELAGNPAGRDRPALWIVDSGSGKETNKETNKETKLSFAALSRRSNQAANFLRAQGLKRGDHLLLLLGNVVPLWETMLAAMKLGVVVIPATTLLTPDELRDRLERGRARVVVASQDQVAKFRGLGGDKLVRMVVGATSQQEGWLPFEEVVNFPETFTPDGPTRADEAMLLYFTSGTT